MYHGQPSTDGRPWTNVGRRTLLVYRPAPPDQRKSKCLVWSLPAQVHANVARFARFVYTEKAVILNEDYTEFSKLCNELLRLTVQYHISALCEIHYHLVDPAADSEQTIKARLLDKFQPSKQNTQVKPLVEIERDPLSVELESNWGKIKTQGSQQAWVMGFVTGLAAIFGDDGEITIAKCKECFEVIPKIGVAVVSQRRLQEGAGLNLVSFLATFEQFLDPIISFSWVSFALACLAVDRLKWQVTDKTLFAEFNDKSFEDISMGIFKRR